MAALSAALALTASRAAAQPKTLPFDHVHLNVPDPAQAVAWYEKYMGAAPGSAPDRVTFGGTLVIFTKTADAQPSAGSAIDHIGFSFADLDAKMKDLEAAGVQVVTPVRDVPGLFKLGFIEDPWGTKIEVVQDADTLGFHHVHLRVPDPEQSFTWYVGAFGGERAKLKGRIDGVKYGDVWILAQKGESVPSAGHAVDHIGWRVANLRETAAALTAAGTHFSVEPRPLGNLQIAFLDGPAGVKIELVQR